MVDKPGRRKRTRRPWGKAAAAVLAALVVVAAGYYVYETYIFVPSPVYAKLGTSQGYVYAELYPSCAPKTVANFVNLAESGFYTDLVWHRVVSGFVIQTGDPNTRGGATNRSNWGYGKSNQSVPFEWCGWLHNYAGYIGMASNANKGPSTSQFYVMLTNNTTYLADLDQNYTVFARVISGMSAVCALANNRTDPVYGSSSLVNQPIYPADAMLNNVTIIPASQAPVPQPIRQC